MTEEQLIKELRALYDEWPGPDGDVIDYGYQCNEVLGNLLYLIGELEHEES